MTMRWTELVSSRKRFSSAERVTQRDDAGSVAAQISRNLTPERHQPAGARILEAKDLSASEFAAQQLDCPVDETVVPKHTKLGFTDGGEVKPTPTEMLKQLYVQGIDVEVFPKAPGVDIGVWRHEALAQVDSKGFEAPRQTARAASMSAKNNDESIGRRNAPYTVRVHVKLGHSPG